MTDVGAEWDGRAWVHRETGKVWDGARWVDRAEAQAGPVPAASWPDPATSGAVPCSAPPLAPSRVAVFAHVAWRALVASIGGGAAIGALLVLGYVVSDAIDPPSSDATPPSDVFFGSYVGGAFGVILGVPAGLVLGLLCAVLTVPYRGPRRTRLVPRVAAIGAVGLFLGALFVLPHLSDHASDLAVGAALTLAGVFGAWFLGGWTVRWYIGRMEALAPSARGWPAS